MNHPGPPPHGPHGPPRGPSRPRPSGRWIVLGCVGMVSVLMALAVAGGLVHLLVRPAAEGPGTAVTEAPAPDLKTFTDPHFSIDYPAHWEEIELGPEHDDAGTIVVLRDAEVDADSELPHDEVTVYRYSSDVHALVECTRQAHWIGFSWDRADEPVDVGPSDLGGREVPHHRVTGEHLGAEALGETWCIDVGDEVMQVAADSFAGGSRSGDVELILASWTWREE